MDANDWREFVGGWERMVSSKKDYEHSQNYYTDTVYCDTYYVLEWLNYVDGRESSGLDWDVKVQSKKYIKQMRKLMGAKKNFEVSSWQLEDKLVVICRVYSRSGGLLQHFTKDIERSLIFQYDPDTDSLHLDNTYEGKELAYWDETWMIYRKGKELFVENIPTHKVSKVFEMIQLLILICHMTLLLYGIQRMGS